MTGKRSDKPLISLPAVEETVEVTISMKKTLFEMIEQYCEFYEKSAHNHPQKSDVVCGALKRLFERDHAFRRFAGLVRPKAAPTKKSKQVKNNKSDAMFALDSEAEAKKTAGWSLPLVEQ